MSVPSHAKANRASPYTTLVITKEHIGEHEEKINEGKQEYQSSRPWNHHHDLLEKGHILPTQTGNNMNHLLSIIRRNDRGAPLAVRIIKFMDKKNKLHKLLSEDEYSHPLPPRDPIAWHLLPNYKKYYQKYERKSEKAI